MTTKLFKNKKYLVKARLISTFSPSRQVDMFRELLISHESAARTKLIERYKKLLNEAVIDKQFLINMQNLELATLSSSTSALFKNNLPIKPKISILPSVTDVISLSQKPCTGPLFNWKLERIRKLGMEGFLKESEQGKSYSSVVHTYVEKILNKEKIQNEIDVEKVKILKNVFPRVGKILLTEANVNHGTLFYKGRFDCLAYLDDEVALIDWKVSNRYKTYVSNLYDSPVQLAAYWSAILNDKKYTELLSKYPIKKVIVVNIHKNTGDLDVHKFDIHMIHSFWLKWLNYLQSFWFTVLSEDGRVELK